MNSTATKDNITTKDRLLLRKFKLYTHRRPILKEDFAMSKRNRHSNSRTPRQPPASGRQPTWRLTARDIATSADELLAFYAHFQSLLRRREQRDWFLFYMCGQLSDLERKTIEPMVLALLGPKVNAPGALPPRRYQWRTPW